MIDKLDSLHTKILEHKDFASIVTESEIEALIEAKHYKTKVSEAINEFAELLKGNLVRKYANAHPTEQYVALQVTDWCNEIAEQLKTGGDSEQNTNSKNKRMLEVRNTKRDICISCCDKSKAAREISINRDGGIYKGSNIVSFSLCNDCLNKLAREFVKFS